MKIHKIKVRDRTVSCDDLELVQGTQGVDAVGLDLDPEWTGLEVTVTFAAAAGNYTPARDGGVWPVPWEVLEAKELKAQIAQTVADARAVLGEIEDYGIAEWSVDAWAHRLLVGPIKSRKDDA